MLNHHSFLSEKAIPLRTEGFITRSSPALYHHLPGYLHNRTFFFRCGHCVHCSNTNDNKLSSYEGKNTNCKATCITYIFECPYGFVYVGQTKRALRIRIAEHKAAICKKEIWITPLHAITQGLIMVLRLL